MLGIRRSGGDPVAERVDLGRRELLARFARRHGDVGITGRESRDQFTLCRLARHDRALAAFELGDRRLELVEPQAGLPRCVVRAVALKAVARQDRPDVAQVVDCRAVGRQDGGGCELRHRQQQ